MYNVLLRAHGSGPSLLPLQGLTFSNKNRIMLQLMLAILVVFGIAGSAHALTRSCLNLAWNYPCAELPNIAYFQLMSSPNPAGPFSPYADVDPSNCIPQAPGSAACVCYFCVRIDQPAAFFIVRAVDHQGVPSAPAPREEESNTAEMSALASS